MNKSGFIIIAIFLAAFSFLAGNLYNRWTDDRPVAGGRKVLYYVDPMHPSYKSDKPGIAPDCGMNLEPVYDRSVSGEEEEAEDDSEMMSPGTVRISPEKQQLIGVKTVRVEKKAVVHNIRVLGRVAIDETRLYVVNATVDGWIKSVSSYATGDFVRKDETLASFYSPEFLSAGQALLFGLAAQDRVMTSGMETQAQDDQITQFKINMQQYKDSLSNLGMGDLQIEEMVRTRKFMENVNIVSPADGFIIARNVYYGQRFEKGTELYRIADLKRVWILADIFENDNLHLMPGMTVKFFLPSQEKAFSARVSNALPQFDPVSRTLKARLETDNPGYLLKPDMFVDIELPVHLPPAMAVPADAVLDSGMRKIVYVAAGNGHFEPRMVETGWRLGNQVEIVEGLMSGEEIVISGNFLIDSESRIRSAAAGIYGVSVKDPVCGMYVDEGKARAAGKMSGHGNMVYYFCSPECKQKFEGSPDAFMKNRGGPMKMADHSSPSASGHD